MTVRRIHSISGLIIALFIIAHLCNHLYSIFDATQHIEVMNSLRLIYRNAFVEPILFLAIFVQLVSGPILIKNNRKKITSGFDKLQQWTGIYLAFFLIIHLSAIIGGRYLLKLDTNFYFGVAGLNSFPFNLFFIPYYAFAIISFFGHIACIHNKKMKHVIFGMTPDIQSKAIIVFGICLTIILFYGLTNHFGGVTIPQEYNILIGK